MTYDSIVLGSGLSGLTCGILLAKSGRRVLIVEQHDRPAPVVRGFYRQGIYFDSGFHYAGGAGVGGPLERFFHHLGLAQRLQLFPFSPGGFDALRIISTGEHFALPVGPAEIKAKLASSYPQLKQELDTYLDEISSRWRDFPYLDPEKEFTGGDLQSVHEQSLAERLEVFSSAPVLQSLLSMHSLLYGVAPHAASVTLNAQVAGSYYHSVHGIVGGGRRLVDAYLDRLGNVGVTVRCNADVVEIQVAEGRVAGVRLAGGDIIAAGEVIATCNPALVPELLPPGVLRPAYKKRLKNLIQTPSALILYARCQDPTDLLRRRNLFLLSQPGTLSGDLGLPLEQRPVYLAGADHCPDNSGARGVIMIVPTAAAETALWNHGPWRRCADYRSWKQELCRRLTQHVADCCPELKELIPLDLATPLTLRDYSRAPQGAIYGVGRVLGQYNPQPATRLPGLYLSGQAVAGPGLLGAISAAYFTCGTLLGHASLRGELFTCR